VVVAKPGHRVDERSVMAHCQDKLAPFKQPKRIIFCEALPKNPSGKLLKRELRTRYA
jgi:fatty-acyl-CoA synthase